MKILHVGVSVHPQPDGCVGYKVGIKTDEPSTRTAWVQYGSGSSTQVISEEAVDHTWYLFGAIRPEGTTDLYLEELIEGTIPDAEPGHDPRHGHRDPLQQ